MGKSSSVLTPKQQDKDQTPVPAPLGPVVTPQPGWTGAQNLYGNSFLSSTLAPTMGGPGAPAGPGAPKGPGNTAAGAYSFNSPLLAPWLTDPNPLRPTPLVGPVLPTTTPVTNTQPKTTPPKPPPFIGPPAPTTTPTPAKTTPPFIGPPAPTSTPTTAKTTPPFLGPLRPPPTSTPSPFFNPNFPFTTPNTGKTNAPFLSPLLPTTTPITPTTPTTGKTTTPPVQTPPVKEPPKEDPRDVVDPKKITEKADALFKAMDGWGTDEGAVMNAMKGMNEAQVTALKKEYEAHYGRSLESDLKGELGGTDLEEAMSHFSGKRVDGALAALKNSTGTFNDDEAKIEQTLRDLSPGDLADLQKRAATDPAIKGLLDKVGGALGGSDKEVYDNLLAGNKVGADAVRLDDAMGSSSSWYNPMSWGTDEEKAYELMGHAKDAKDGLALQKAFNERMEAKGVKTTLTQQIGSEFGGAEKDVADALIQGDHITADAARLKVAADGMGTDENKIFSSFEDKSPDERKNLVAAYEKKYGANSFSGMLGDELGEQDKLRAEQLVRDGKLDDLFALNYAMDGIGTDEDMLKKVFKGKSVDEIKTMKTAYETKYKRSLDGDMGSEISGRDSFDVDLMMKYGEPKSAEDKHKVAAATYDYERGSGSNGFSRFMMDSTEFIGMHSKGSQMDRQMGRMNEMFDENGKRKASASEDQVNEMFGWQQTDVKNYQAAKDSVADGIATGVEITAAAIATVLTDGGASPWLVAAITGVGGLAGMGVKKGMQGDAYGSENAMADLGLTGVNMLTAGLGEAKFVTNALEKVTAGVNNPVMKEFIKNGLKTGGQNGLQGMYQGVTNEKNWDAGVENWGLGILTGTGKGMGTGFLSGGTQAGIKTKLGPQTGFFGSIGAEGMSQGGGSMVTTLLDPETWSSDPEEVFKKIGKGTGKGMATGFLTGGIERYQRSSRVGKQLADGVDPANIKEWSVMTDREKAEALGHVPSPVQTDPVVQTPPTPVVDPTLAAKTTQEKPVALGDDGQVKVTTPEGETSKVKTPDTTETHSTQPTDPQHPTVETLEQILGSNKKELIGKHLDQLSTSGTDIDALALSYNLPEMVKNMTPDQMSAFGEHFFNEGNALSQAKTNGTDVTAQWDRSRLLGTSWVSEMAKLGLDPWGNKIDPAMHGPARPLPGNMQ